MKRHGSWFDICNSRRSQANSRKGRLHCRSRKQNGFLESLCGPGGRPTLARPAGAIDLGAVIRAAKDNLALVECFDPARNTCVVAPACGLRGPLEEALAAFVAVVDSYSLADLVAKPGACRRMQRLLSGPRPAA